MPHNNAWGNNNNNNRNNIDMPNLQALGLNPSNQNPNSNQNMNNPLGKCTIYALRSIELMITFFLKALA